MKLPEGLKGAQGVVLDTNILIYCFEDHPQYGRVAEFLLQQAEAGSYHGVVTPVTAAELLVKPLKAGRADLADRYRAALAHLPNIACIGISHELGCMAGALRAQYGLPLPDMFQVAAALMSPTPTLITNDRVLKQVSDVRVILLGEVARR